MNVRLNIGWDFVGSGGRGSGSDRWWVYFWGGLFVDGFGDCDLRIVGVTCFWGFCMF